MTLHDGLTRVGRFEEWLLYLYDVGCMKYALTTNGVQEHLYLLRVSTFSRLLNFFAVMKQLEAESK